MQAPLRQNVKKFARDTGIAAAIGILWGVAAAMLGGCVDHVSAPSSAKLRAAAARLFVAVAKTTSENKVTKSEYAKVAASHQAEGAKIEAATAKVDRLPLVFRNSPMQALPLIEEIQNDLRDWRIVHGVTAQGMNLLSASIGRQETNLAEAAAARADVQKLTPEYFAGVNALADKYNALADTVGELKRKIVWLEVKSWARSLFGWFGLLALVGLAALFFLSRMSNPVVTFRVGRVPETTPATVSAPAGPKPAQPEPDAAA